MYRPNFARVALCMFAKGVESPVMLSQPADIALAADSNQRDTTALLANFKLDSVIVG